MRGALMLTVLLAVPAHAQQEEPGPFERAHALERRGNLVAALEAYREGLARTPGDLNGLMGFERVLFDLGRSGEVAPYASAALARDPENTVLFALAVRAWTAAGVADSVRALVERWARLEPGSDAPYREWGFAALMVRDRESARLAFRTGRERLGRQDALAGELAQLAALDQEWESAAVEWLTAVRARPDYRAAAVAMLGSVPPERQRQILDRLDRERDPAAAGFAAALAVRWGDPLDAQARLFRHLPPDRSGTVLLQDLLAELTPVPGREATLARARTLEALGERARGNGTRYLTEAARAYAEAGEQAAARRLLTRLGPSQPGADVAAAAAVTSISVLIAEGRLEEAAARLGDQAPTLPLDDLERLSHRLARGYIHAGALDRAEALLAADSTVEGLALRGRVALYRGDLPTATRFLTMAGPYAVDRADATERAGVLAVLQVVDQDSCPALGAAFLALDRGDTATAAPAFALLAGRLDPERGGAELFLLAGRLHAGREDLTAAERLFRLASGTTGSAAGPAARLDLARVLLRQGREGEAITALEALILDHPGSAVAPQARRLLDMVRGGVPG